MNPRGSGRFFLLSALESIMNGKPTGQLAEDQMMRWHMERQPGWFPLGREAGTGIEHYTTLERGIQNAVTLAEAAALTGYVSEDAK